MVELTEAEKELIEAIRNFKKSQHNPSIDLEFWIRELFERLLHD
ncbi:ArsR family transcriptional regulator [Aequorivita sp. H23M31]|uniref:ArsR family transcriptional regulator n=1 Tax=Aequorivita ciconiae TaxID=2494375 RepID=A0A410G7E8_9FLAO|nr:ArsR family transcriptional regulator [Aequorivita sp. H23M31]